MSITKAKIIDSVTLSKNIIYELQKKITIFKEKNKKELHIAIIQLGDNESSQLYIKKKIQIAEAIGIKISHQKFSQNEKEDNIIKSIHNLNQSKEISGIILQMPIPDNFNKLKLLNAINAQKDIDGLNPINVGLLFSKSNQCFIPPTAQGCLELLKFYKIEIKSKHIVIVNRSNLVGKPLVELFLREDATITICHSQTKNLANITKLGDIVICAIGKANYFTKEYFNENATVIDVGVNKILDKNSKIKTVGDVNFENVKEHVAYLTPVPKSIGPLTIAFLLINSFIAAQLNNMQE
ncbi:MAG: bifunctional 5,10-methylenetetrahydrofolate dehydrogenase/5,10-methenyltetrahydrofolate cyclohydrolase [Rickettsia sp.]|nr:bifunctional 5,10-methylenetetrahydrofolate dehydrogenase/5,10-methenyltetrahydrofolate cyclohydrolase [Rickettsia sp.]